MRLFQSERRDKASVVYIQTAGYHEARSKKLNTFIVSLLIETETVSGESIIRNECRVKMKITPRKDLR